MEANSGPSPQEQQAALGEMWAAGGEMYGVLCNLESDDARVLQALARWRSACDNPAAFSSPPTRPRSLSAVE